MARASWAIRSDQKAMPIFKQMAAFNKGCSTRVVFNADDTDISELLPNLCGYVAIATVADEEADRLEGGRPF